ncbi:MAG TPA: DUF4424 family protein [Candidatus Binatia bacterium]|nr:DUF4424 family protein [Candidatus Binatia bacterium]
MLLLPSASIKKQVTYPTEMLPSRYFSRIPLLFLFLFAALPSIRANDTLVTLAAGGLVPMKSSTVIMESENLHITLHRVTVDYVFRNASNQDIDAIVAFPMPELDGSILEVSPVDLPSKDPTNFMSFKLTVDGKPVSPKIEVRAFKKDEDITEKLKSLGVPVSVLDPRLKAAVAKLPKVQITQLAEQQWIVNENPDPAGKDYSGIWPWWQTRIQFYWTQHFRANSTLHVSHTYVPVVGGSYIDDDGSHIAQRYCGGAALDQIKELKTKVEQRQEPGLALWWRGLQYILTTANNWAGPIKHFHMQIDSDSTDDILLTCMPSIRQTAPAHYELDASDFHPDRNLAIVILQPHQNQSASPATQ